MPIASPAQDILNELGIDAVCELIAEGTSYREIARRTGVNISTLLLWIDRDFNRSARATEARRVTAAYWDQEAEAAIKKAPKTNVEIARARELAQHYRWRAKMVNPRDYGDKVDLTHRGGIAVVKIPLNLDLLSDEQREVIRDVLLLAPPTIEGSEE